MNVKLRRNDPCSCGSGKKYKKCCELKQLHPPQAAAPTPAEMSRLIAMTHAGRYAEVEETAWELVRRHPNSGHVWKILGLSLWRQGKDPLDALEYAAKQLPDDAEAHTNLGNALRLRGRPDDALSRHRRAIDITPGYAEAHNNLGSALQDLGRLDEAAASYRRAAELKPDFAMAHANLANALLDLAQPPAAAASYRRALQLNPDSVAVLIGLGSALRDLGQTDAAEASYRRALHLQPNSAELHHNLAVLLRMQNRTAEAEASCRKALELNAALVAAIVLLAKLLADRGDFKEAERLLGHAIEIEPNSAQAWSGIPSLRRMTLDDIGWLTEAQRIADRHPPPRQEAHLRYALGKYFDDVRDFARAFADYRRANELTKRCQAPHDRQHLAQFVRRIARLHDGEWVNRTRINSNASPRPVFIVGMPRSGTTLAEQILASHPAVFGAGELPFWGVSLARCLSGDSNGGGGGGGGGNAESAIGALAGGYMRLIGELSAEAVCVIDKMPANFLSIGLIHAALPNARIIHMRRNPIDTCLSVYFQDFEAAYSYASDLGDLAHCYAEYVGIMGHWRSILRAGTILDVPYEGLVEDPEQWTREMLRFIGLPWDARCMQFHQTSRTVSTVSGWQVRQAINSSSVGRWRNYEQFVGPLLELAAFKDID
jgi:tetratricopeptide (TPR) repeat protein